MLSFNKNLAVLSIVLLSSSCEMYTLPTVSEEKNELIRERLATEDRFPANNAIKQRIMDAEISAQQEEQRKGELINRVMNVQPNSGQVVNYHAQHNSATQSNFVQPSLPQTQQIQANAIPPAPSSYAKNPTLGMGSMDRMKLPGYNAKPIPKNYGGDNPWQYMPPPSYAPADEVQRNEMMMKSNLGLHKDFEVFNKNAASGAFNPQPSNRIASTQNFDSQPVQVDMQQLQQQYQLNDKDFENQFNQRLNDPSIFSGALPANGYQPNQQQVNDFAPTGYNSPVVGSQTFGNQYQNGTNPNNFMPAAPAMPFPVNQQKIQNLQPPYNNGVRPQPYNQPISIEDQKPNLLQSMKPINSDVKFQFKNDGAYVVDEGNSSLPASMRKSYEKRKPSGFETVKFQVPAQQPQQQNQLSVKVQDGSSASNYGMMQMPQINVPSNYPTKYGQPQTLYEQPSIPIGNGQTQGSYY